MQTQTRRTQIGLAFDAETNPSYYRASHYDPAAGRFLSTNQIRFVAGVNFYRGSGTRPNWSRAVCDGGGSAPTATVTHGASKGGVAPASSEVWAASFLVAAFGVISFFPLRFAALQG